MGTLKKAFRDGAAGLVSGLIGTIIAMGGVLLYGYYSTVFGAIVILIGAVLFFIGFIKLAVQYYQER